MRHHFTRSRFACPPGEESCLRKSDTPPLDDMIGRRLRRHYEDLEEQPLPDRLTSLLRALDQAPQSGQKDWRN